MTKTLLDKINSGREYRSLTLEAKEAEDDKESYIVEGYATTFNEAYTLFEDDEMKFVESVSPEAFSSCDMSDVIFQYDHEGRVFARLSNNTLRLEVDQHGLKVTADLGGTEAGRQLYEEIRGGYTNKMSFGFTVAEDEETTAETEAKTLVARVIKKIGKLYDVSAVSLPANDGTEISARSYCKGVIMKRQSERTLKADINNIELRLRYIKALQLELAMKN